MLLLTQVNFKILLTVNKFSAKIMGWAASTCFDNVLTCKEHLTQHVLVLPCTHHCQFIVALSPDFFARWM